MERMYEVTITGRTPLIMHADNIEWADAIAAERDNIKRQDKANFAAGDDRCPPSTWKGCLYFGADGHITMPTDNLKSGLVKAGAMVTLSKQTTFKRLAASGLIFPSPDTVFLANGKNLKQSSIEAIKGNFKEQLAAVRGLGFDLLMKRAKIGASKHVRIRPIFKTWSITTEVVVIDDQITESALREIFEKFGLRVGLGDWRPSSDKSPGPYGMFDVTLKLMK